MHVAFLVAGETLSGSLGDSKQATSLLFRMINFNLSPWDWSMRSIGRSADVLRRWLQNVSRGLRASLHRLTMPHAHCSVTRSLAGECGRGCARLSVTCASCKRARLHPTAQGGRDTSDKLSRREAVLGGVAVASSLWHSLWPQVQMLTTASAPCGPNAWCAHNRLA